MSINATAGAVIFAKSVAKVASFYEAALSASVVHAARDHTVLATGPIQIVIHAIPERVAQHIVIQSPPEVRDETPIKLYFLVDSLAQVRAKASAAGGGLLPLDKEWSAPGFRACDGWDPEGNVVQFRQNSV